MTTVACDRKIMAADTFDSNGGRADKIIKVGACLVGETCADIYYSARLIRWIMEGMRGGPPIPDDNEDAEGELLILKRAGIFTIDRRGVEVRRADNFFAIGSGAQYALGAMGMGATPAQAVEVAAQYDSGTKLPLTTAKLR